MKKNGYTIPTKKADLEKKPAVTTPAVKVDPSEPNPFPVNPVPRDEI